MSTNGPAGRPQAFRHRVRGAIGRAASRSRALAGKGWGFVRTAHNPLSAFFAWLAQRTTEWVGSSWVFMLAALLVLVWLASGPFFKWSDTWQLVMNTVSSIVTFLMVFLIQRSQNKDTLAIQLKLNEIIAAMKGASNRLINIESLSDEEVLALRERYERLADVVKEEANVTRPHTVEEALAEAQEAVEEAENVVAEAAGGGKTPRAGS
jgi:low affinity Fe/Cu permease